MESNGVLPQSQSRNPGTDSGTRRRHLSPQHAACRSTASSRGESQALTWHLLPRALVSLRDDPGGCCQVHFRRAARPTVMRRGTAQRLLRLPMKSARALCIVCSNTDATKATGPSALLVSPLVALCVHLLSISGVFAGNRFFTGTCVAVSFFTSILRSHARRFSGSLSGRRKSCCHTINTASGAHRGGVCSADRCTPVHEFYGPRVSLVTNTSYARSVLGRVSWCV